MRVPRKERGFSLIELIVVVGIISAIAAVAVPSLLRSRGAANEAAAIATIRNLHSAQAHCVNRKFIDMDSDGAGEYGFFGELAGGIPPRSNVGVALLPPLLASAFQNVQNGFVTRSGYNFSIFLPDAAGVGLPEAAANYANVNPNLAANFWCCYAWPTAAGTSGQRAFFTNQLGELLWTDNTVQRYSGGLASPAPDAIFLPGSAGAITGPIAPGAAGSDGGIWRVVNS